MRYSRCHRTLCVLSAALLIMPALVGCNMNPVPGGDEAPDIPPESTFVMDFGDFAGNNAAARVQGSLPGGNWLFAAGTVAVWNTIITATLVVPVAAFVESFNHEPMAQPDGSWAWEYSFVANGANHTARLTAQIADGGIEWNMFISKDGEFSDVLWFTGQSNLNGTEGTWTLNRDPRDLTPFIRIDWQRDPSAGTGQIRYTNIVPDGSENGSFIEFARTNDMPFDAFYDVFNAGEDVMTSIEWNRTGKDGRVMNSNFFGDMAWHCWDKNFQNADCP